MVTSNLALHDRPIWYNIQYENREQAVKSVFTKTGAAANLPD